MYVRMHTCMYVCMYVCAASMPGFRRDLVSWMNHEGSVEGLVEFYNIDVQHITNYHALSCPRTITMRPGASRYLKKLRPRKELRKKAETTWHRISLTAHYEIYRKLCRHLKTALFQYVKQFRSTKIKECGKDQKKLYTLTRKLIDNSTCVKYLYFTSSDILAEKFNDFFVKKKPV